MEGSDLAAIWESHKGLSVTSEAFFDVCQRSKHGTDFAQLRRVNALLSSPSARSTTKWALRMLREAESVCLSKQHFTWLANFALLLMHGHSILERCVSLSRPGETQHDLMRLFAERAGAVVFAESTLVEAAEWHFQNVHYEAAQRRLRSLMMLRLTTRVPRPGVQGVECASCDGSRADLVMGVRNLWREVFGAQVRRTSTCTAQEPEPEYVVNLGWVRKMIALSPSIKQLDKQEETCTAS